MDKRGIIFFTAIAIIFLMGDASAGIGDWFKGFTGRATDSDLNFSITVSNPIAEMSARGA